MGPIEINPLALAGIIVAVAAVALGLGILFGFIIRKFVGEAKVGTAERRAKELIAESEKQAESMKSEFISSVSHELRTPLTAITGWAETIAYDPAVKDDSLRGINIISKEAERLTGMVAELLEFTRIQDGRFNLNVELIDITAELEDALFTYGELIKQAGMEVNYSEPPAEIPLIPGDPERLKQVFLNLIDNAAKHGSPAPLNISAAFCECSLTMPQAR